MLHGQGHIYGTHDAVATSFLFELQTSLFSGTYISGSICSRTRAARQRIHLGALACVQNSVLHLEDAHWQSLPLEHGLSAVFQSY